MDANSLRTRRKDLALTQDELAERLGVSRNTIVSWEKGIRAIPPYLSLALQQLTANLQPSPGTTIPTETARKLVGLMEPLLDQLKTDLEQENETPEPADA